MRTRTADGPTPPGGSDTSPHQRVDVTGIGGVDIATNEQASRSNERDTGKPNPGGYKQVDVLGVGGTGVENVSADSEESLPTAGEKSDDSGFETSKQIESIPTKTYGDKDGEHSGVGDPVTSETPEWQDTNWDKATYSNQRWAYESGPLETLDQQGGDNGGLQNQSPSRGVQPSDPIGTKDTDRVNLTESLTSPDNNSGPTDTWSGTDGNGVLRQQEPVTREDQSWGDIKVPDVTLTTSPVSTKEIPSGGGSSSLTSKVSLAALRLARAEVELGLTPKEEEFNRVAALDREHPAKLAAQLETLARVKTAGLNKLAAHRTSGVSRVPPRFSRIATGAESTEPTPVSDESFDAGLFLR